MTIGWAWIELEILRKNSILQLSFRLNIIRHTIRCFKYLKQLLIWSCQKLSKSWNGRCTLKDIRKWQWDMNGKTIWDICWKIKRKGKKEIYIQTLMIFDVFLGTKWNSGSFRGLKISWEKFLEVLSFFYFDCAI